MSTSTYISILDAVRDRIRQLNLPEIPDSQVVSVKVFTPEVIEALPGLPAAVIGPPERANVLDLGGTNERDDIGYPVQVWLVAADNQENDEVERYNRHAWWHERIRQALIHRALPQVAGAYTSRLESQHILDPLPWKRRNLWVGSLVVRFICREARIS